MDSRLGRCALVTIGLVLRVAVGEGVAAERGAGHYARRETWAETLLASRAALRTADLPAEEVANARTEIWERVREDFAVEWDWVLQDLGPEFPVWFEAEDDERDVEDRLIERALNPLGAVGAGLRSEFEGLRPSEIPGNDPRWLRLYERAAGQRRAQRLATLLREAPRIVFTKHRTIRPSFFAYTEGQSDAQHERHFLPGSELCLLELKADGAQVRTLLADPKGAIRDPAVSWDGGRVLFAWKKSLDEDDYHLYEMEVASGRVRQLTSGLGFADYEPAYLPNDDIIFSSTRCVQTVDCWWTEVSNLYTCDPDGRYLRRLGFDQVHTVFPQVLDDGRVIYTRWDYSDRGQIFPQALFQMNPDGTGQTEFYGNNSWFPTTMSHARGIPNSERVMAILCGHHSAQAGKLAMIDPAKGRQENAGVQLVAPVRETKAERIDSYGQEGELFQYPYPLNEREWIVAYAPFGWDDRGRASRGRDDAGFAIYWMNVDGARELLAADPEWPCQQPVPLIARRRPMLRPTLVDFHKTNGVFYMQDIYGGPWQGVVLRGSIEKLRVVALKFRPAGLGNNGSSGPAGGALVCTPVAIGNGSWDVKVVLGEATVHPDGSAFFTVPARTPVYFQAIDRNGFAVQTMRSWSTLQPGETASCVGCHENKNAAPPNPHRPVTSALKAGVQELQPFYGPARGFSFRNEIQPILDRHCVRCHYDREKQPEFSRLDRALTREPDPQGTVPPEILPALIQPPGGSVSAPTSDLEVPVSPAFSLLAAEQVDFVAKRRWSDAYLNLTLAHPDRDEESRGSFRGKDDGLMVNWISSQSIPAPLPPYAAGAARSELFKLMRRGHYGTRLSGEEWDKLACWIDLLVPFCGDYTEANAWSEEERRKYEHYAAKRRRMEAEEQVKSAEWVRSETVGH